VSFLLGLFGFRRRAVALLGAGAVILTALHFGLNNGPQSACNASGTVSGRITRTTDGDTVHVALCGRDATVRVIGMDSPEVHKPGVPVQCFGPEAADYASHRLAGRMVTLIPDRAAGTRDQYGRLLYRIEVDGQDFAAGSIRAGFARHNDYGHRESQSAVYGLAEAQARREHLGVWTCPDPFKR
jgi:micrococcal nuclease